MITPVYRAYAKINVGLLVLRKRPDGYHEIETLLHRIALWDDISFAPDDGITMTSSDPLVPVDDTNLCLRAALLLREALRSDHGVRLHLEKRIPIGAGLGGGSADAATVLLRLPGFWGHSVEKTLLHDLAVQLGSDVPFFLRPGSARARGRGEILDDVDLHLPFWILVCHPGIHISTSWAYSRVIPRSGRSLPSAQLLTTGTTPAVFREIVNDFEEPVFTAHPAIRQVRDIMLDAGALFSLLSGSGSSVYAFFQDQLAAAALGSRLVQMGYSTFLTPPGFRP